MLPCVTGWLRATMCTTLKDNGQQMNKVSRQTNTTAAISRDPKCMHDGLFGLIGRDKASQSQTRASERFNAGKRPKDLGDGLRSIIEVLNIKSKSTAGTRNGAWVAGGA